MKLGKGLVLVTILLSLQLPALAAQVQNIRTSSSATRVRVVLDLDSPMVYKDNSSGQVVTLDLNGTVKQKQNLKVIK